MDTLHPLHSRSQSSGNNAINDLDAIINAEEKKKSRVEIFFFCKNILFNSKTQPAMVSHSLLHFLSSYTLQVKLHLLGQSYQQKLIKGSIDFYV